jgi:hypothetical protein
MIHQDCVLELVNCHSEEPRSGDEESLALMGRMIN